MLILLISTQKPYFCDNDVITTDIKSAGIHLLNYHSFRAIQSFSFLDKSTQPVLPLVVLTLCAKLIIQSLRIQDNSYIYKFVYIKNRIVQSTTNFVYELVPAFLTLFYILYINIVIDTYLFIYTLLSPRRWSMSLESSSSMRNVRGLNPGSDRPKPLKLCQLINMCPGSSKLTM